MKTVYERWKKTSDYAGYQKVSTHESREAAAAASDVPDLSLWQISGNPINRHVDTVGASWIIGEEQEAETDTDRGALALNLALSYGQIDGSHHKNWVIDQMVRILAGDQYESVIADRRFGADGPDTYSWDEGIAP